MSHIQVPHFEYPFRFSQQEGSGSEAVVVEQDSEEEIMTCINIVIRCPEGFRAEKPDFGIPDMTFRTIPLNVEAVEQKVLKWEPRGQTSFSDEGDVSESLVAKVAARVFAGESEANLEGREV